MLPPISRIAAENMSQWKPPVTNPNYSANCSSKRKIAGAPAFETSLSNNPEPLSLICRGRKAAEQASDRAQARPAMRNPSHLRNADSLRPDLIDAKKYLAIK